jgi:hypothetical protein
MASTFARAVSRIALDQHARFQIFRETDPPLARQIEAYWRDLGFPFPGVATPWSAVFVSWCVKQAGATRQQFQFNPQHSVFVHRAIQNQLAGTGGFWGHPVDAHAPKLGDIVQNNRSGNQFDFDHARRKTSYASHTAIVVEVGQDPAGKYLRTIGGNEGDTVGLREVRLDAKGRVKQVGTRYISVIEARI